MCWITYRPSHAKPLIANEDIPVQKILNCRGVQYTSPYFHQFVWAFDHIHKCKMGDLYYDGITAPSWVIQQGFHSCKGIELRGPYFVEKTSRLIVADNSVPGRIIVNGIIPKGAIYYVNEYNVYVSNQLKLIS